MRLIEMATPGFRAGFCDALRGEIARTAEDDGLPWFWDDYAEGWHAGGVERMRRAREREAHVAALIAAADAA